MVFIVSNTVRFINISFHQNQVQENFMQLEIKKMEPIRNHPGPLIPILSDIGGD